MVLAWPTLLRADSRSLMRSRRDCCLMDMRRFSGSASHTRAVFDVTEHLLFDVALISPNFSSSANLGVIDGLSILGFCLIISIATSA